MASPQPENGFTKFANELLEAFARNRLAGQEYQVVLAVARKTYGYNKKAGNISYGQIAKTTNLDRRRVNKIVKDLNRKKVLGVTNNGDRQPLTVWINKDYEKWQTVTKNGDIPNNDDSSVPSNGVKPVPNNGDSHIKKEKKEKKEIPPKFLDLSERFHKYQKKQLGKLVQVTEKTNLDGAGVLEKLVRLDGFDLDGDIKPALMWAVKDSWWSYRIRTLPGLRGKGKNGQTKFSNMFSDYQQANPKQKTPLVY